MELESYYDKLKSQGLITEMGDEVWEAYKEIDKAMEEFDIEWRAQQAESYRIASQTFLT